MIHKSSTEPKMALHLLIAAQQEMHWKTDTRTNTCTSTDVLKAAARCVWNVLWTYTGGTLWC